MYRLDNGPVYDQRQFDSILGAGNVAISLISSEKKGDTIFVNSKINKIAPQEIVGKYEKKQLPALSFSDIRGRRYDSRKLKGYVLYFNFWSVFCGPCVAEIPDLNQLKDLYKGKKALFFAIAPESEAELKTFLAAHPFNFNIVSSSALFKELGIDGYPAHFFIDRNGVIRKVSTGTPLKKNPDTGKWEVNVVGSNAEIMNQLK